MMNQRSIGLILSSLFLVFSLAGCNNNDSPTDDSGSGGGANPRGAKATPGDAEVIAKKGYTHTVFDSAKEKCQHCHNDLYDTWAQSGHSNAWSDVIYQGELQGVIRARLTQLDLSNPDNHKIFKSRVKFCVKCHAPTALYSNDIKIDLEEVALPEGKTLDKATLAQLKSENDDNLVGPNFDPSKPTTVVGFDNKGKVYKSTLHIGNAHNREGVNCAYCHSIETVRMLSATGDDGGKYKLAKTLPDSGFSAGDVLNYSKDGESKDMNSFFRFAVAEMYKDYSKTPKTEAEFDVDKVADGRHTIKSIVEGQYTGGPYYGPFGVTGTTNNNASDTVDRAALLKTSFTDNPESQHFGEQSKGLCLSCHQCAMGRKNGEGHFNTGCAIWQANSGFGDAASNTSTDEAPKCTKCHMEIMENKTVLHKWNKPDELFESDKVTAHFDPANADSLVSKKHMNSHAFMATQVQKYGPAKLKSAVEGSLQVSKAGNIVTATAYLLNKTGHFFPGTMPMRRGLLRIVATDSTGKLLPFKQATGLSEFVDIEHDLVTLPNESIPQEFSKVTRKAPTSPIAFAGKTPDLDGSAVLPQKFDASKVSFVSAHPEAFIGGGTPTLQDSGVWRYEGTVKARTIVDDADPTNFFTRIYGYQVVADAAGKTILRPGLDSTGVVSTSLSPNEKETYTVEFDASAATGDITVTYKTYYMRKGGNTKFPIKPDGFLNESAPDVGKLLITELFTKTEVVQ